MARINLSDLHRARLVPMVLIVPGFVNVLTLRFLIVMMESRATGGARVGLDVRKSVAGLG